MCGRAVETGSASFLTSSVPRDGSTVSCRPSSRISRAIRSAAGYDQIGRALRNLVSRGKLLKIGSGLYVRARPSTLDGSPTPVKGLRTLADEALRRLGIRTGPTRLEQAY